MLPVYLCLGSRALPVHNLHHSHGTDKTPNNFTGATHDSQDDTYAGPREDVCYPRQRQGRGEFHQSHHLLIIFNSLVIIWLLGSYWLQY